MKHQYWVVSPEFEVYSGNLYGGSPEPPEYGSAVQEVWAYNKREAKIIAVTKPDGNFAYNMKKWVDEARADKKNPFSGLKVEHASCSHHECLCNLPDGICDACEKEDMAAYKAEFGS